MRSGIRSWAPPDARRAESPTTGQPLNNDWKEEDTVMFVPVSSRLFARRSLARIVGGAAVTAGLLAIAVPALAQEASAKHGGKGDETIVFTIDVAEDLAGKFVPTHVKPEHTQPERGSFFVTEGRIFPGGTIQGDGAGFDPYRSGHIGVWICRGTHLVSASEIPAAPLWVSSAQLYVIGRQGKEQIATEGVEGAGTHTRIVTGGAGNFAGFVGEQKQTFLGFNSTGGVNLRVTFILRPVSR
jgi:hypothetical protein